MSVCASPVSHTIKDLASIVRKDRSNNSQVNLTLAAFSHVNCAHQLYSVYVYFFSGRPISRQIMSYVLSVYCWATSKILMLLPRDVLHSQPQSLRADTGYQR